MNADGDSGRQAEQQKFSSVPSPAGWSEVMKDDLTGQSRPPTTGRPVQTHKQTDVRIDRQTDRRAGRFAGSRV